MEKDFARRLPFKIALHLVSSEDEYNTIKASSRAITPIVRESMLHRIDFDVNGRRLRQTIKACKVVAVGPGDRNRDGQLIPVGVKGDTVLLPEYGGTEVKLGEKSKYWIPSPLSVFGLSIFAF
ncbi:PREDICTED: 10 kDa heat shock protein, mitochondrial-like [Nelumbo nucifera]|uniref:10 kDa heat shock protein, mitochondrial-like n=1 Tax=Nelumbo nucifera TaxID=4432 RepID=A0A1U8BIR4_NELNU|nr:PREDICTED: 10 kDa heat shock protein, mitochondrial-like [Nelumbo nucifera]